VERREGMNPQFAVADLAELLFGRVEHRIRQVSLLGLLA
jgi:hypothetical protein